MPPLSKRASDLPQLLDELLLRHCQENRCELRLAPEALAALARYPWPGNIRELGNLVERLAIMCPDGEIGLDDLPARYRDCPPSADAGDEPPVLPAAANLKSYLQDVERELIAQALEKAGGVVAEAARQLRMQRTTLLEKINKYGIA